MRRTHGKTRAAGTARGFTLVEALVGGTLMTLLLLGTMTLFTESSRATQRTTVAVQATQDGTYGLQYILSNTREALVFCLPQDTAAASVNGLAFTAPTGSVASYMSGTTNEAIELEMPAAATSKKTENGDTVATLGYDLLDANGQHVYPLGYDRTGTAMDLVWIYRGDQGGQPNAVTGQFLWSRLRAAGKPADGSRDKSQVICKLILTKHADGTDATDAVQFLELGASPDIQSQYEVDVKIVSGDMTSINKTQTNEATNGSSINQLFGKCALMRNHK